MKKILHIDMDNVLVDFMGGAKFIDEKTLKLFHNRLDAIPGIFSLMPPYPGALESYCILKNYFEIHILSSAPWDNPTAWSDKLLWVQKYLGEDARKKLTLTHNKNLVIGDYLIDDRKVNGAEIFCGEFIHFGTDVFPDWNVVVEYLLKRNGYR